MPSEMMVCPRCWGAPGALRVCDRCDGARMVPDVRLSRSFWLSEMVRSETAQDLGIPNDAPARALRRLLALSQWLLQPVRDSFGPLLVTSGYRSERVNRAVGGAAGSAHLTGDAADVRPLHVDPVEIMRWLPTSGAEWDQAILYPGRVHLALRHPRSGQQRRELRVAHGGGFPAWRDAA